MARALPGTLGVFVMAGVVRVVPLNASGGGCGMETPSLKHPVRVRFGPDGDDFVQPGLRERHRERFRALGEGVEERGGKHVAGHPADGIQMYMHARDSTPVPRRSPNQTGPSPGVGWIGREIGGLEVGLAVVVEYAAGHAADGVQRYVHVYDSTLVPVGFRIGQLGVSDAWSRLRIHALFRGQTLGPSRASRNRRHLLRPTPSAAASSRRPRLDLIVARRRASGSMG